MEYTERFLFRIIVYFTFYLFEIIIYLLIIDSIKFQIKIETKLKNFDCSLRYLHCIKQFFTRIFACWNFFFGQIIILDILFV